MLYNQLEAYTTRKEYHTERFHFQRTTESIRHELFLQQYLGPNAIDTPYQCLASPHGCMDNVGSHVDYSKRQHTMHHGLQVIDSPVLDSQDGLDF